MYEWEEAEPDGDRIHVWENQHGDKMYILDRYSNFNFIGEPVERYEIKMESQSVRRFGWMQRRSYGMFKSEEDAVEHAVDILMGKDYERRSDDDST